MKNTSLEIKLTLGSAEVKTGLARVLADFKAASSGITQSLQSIKGFADLKKRTAEIAKDYGEAQRKVAELARKMADGAGGAALAKDFDKAKLAAAKLKTELAAQQQQLHSVRGAMAAAGVSTSNMAGQQSALRSQLEATKKKYQELANVAQARITLGLTPHSDIAKEIDRAKAAYATLRTSGLATTNELAQAKVRLRERIDELRVGTNGWKAALGNVKMGMLEIAAVAAPTVLAIAQAIKFESSMANVKKVMEGTPQEFAALRGELLELTRVIPLTANELAAIATAGGQLGIASRDMTAFVTVTAKMATAFDMTADAAGDAIGKITTLYGLSIPEIEALGDTINRLGNTTASKEKDIVDVMLRIGGSVKQVGMGNDQAAALASTMLSLGMQTEVAGTAINAMINRLQTGTMMGGEFQDALAKVGLNAEEMATMISTNPQQAIDTLLTSLGQLSGQKQAEVLTGLFGREHQDEIARLVTGVDAYRKSMADLGIQANVTGGMNKEFEERTKTTANQLQLLKNAVNEAGIDLGSVFLPAIRDIIAPITAGIRLLADFTSQFPNLSAAMVTMGTGAVAFGTIVKMAGIARLAVIGVKTDVIAAFEAIQGTSLGAWAASTITAIRSVKLEAMTLKTTIGAFAGALLAWEVGKWFGGIVGQFDWVQRGMVNLIGTADRVGLEAQRVWAKLTGTDADLAAIDRKIAISKDAQKKVLEDIAKGQGPGELNRPQVAQPGPAAGPSSAPAAADPAAPAQKGADSYRTPEYLDRLDEAVLSPEELADRKERWAEREQQEKDLNDEKNAKLDEVAKANAEEDAKRAENRAADHKRKIDTDSIYYDRDYADRYAAEQQRIANEEARKNRPPQQPRQEYPSPDKAHSADKKKREETSSASGSASSTGTYLPAGLTDAEKEYEKEQKNRDADAITRNLNARYRAADDGAALGGIMLDSSAYVKRGEEILKRGKRRVEQLEEKHKKDAAEKLATAEQAASQLRTAELAKTLQEEAAKRADAEKVERDAQEAQRLKLAESAKKSAAERAAAEGAAVKSAQSIWEKYASRVKELQDEIAGRERSLADELSDLDPHATEEQRWRRKAKAASDYEKAAKAAMAAGRLDEARDYADQAQSSYSGLKDGGGRINDGLAGRTAFAGVRSAGNLGLAISKMMADAAAKAAQSGIKGIDGLNNRVSAQLQKAMGALADASPSGPGKQQPVQVHEIRLGKARLQGTEGDVADFLKQLERAGLTA